MPRYAAFLRAVNVGGTGVITMDALKAALARAGFTRVTTLLASGNVVFDSAHKSGHDVEAAIETLLAQTFDLNSATFVRSADEMHALLDDRPFDQPLGPSDVVHIGLLKTALDATQRKALAGLTAPYAEFETRHRAIYWLRHRELEPPRLTNVPIEKTLGLLTTIRTIGTIEKTRAKMG
jgi:uncharacterized protein (DUF1697 family)